MDMPAEHHPTPAMDDPTVAEGEHTGHAMGTLPAGMAVLWIVASFALMFGAAWTTSLAAPIRFTF